MNKLIVFYAVMFVFCTILSSFGEGGGGFVTTQLNGAIDDDDVTITVDSTTGYLTADWIVMGDEEVAYTGTTAVTFTGCTRGYNGTEATDHEDDAAVFSPDSGVLNRALGFNVASTGSTAGTFAVVTMTFSFLTKSLPNLIMWDYNFLEGNLLYLRYMLMAVSIGIVVYLGIALVNAGMGIFRPG